MRVDRLVTLAVSNGRQWFAGGATAPRLPILMYHSICEECEGRAAYFRVVTRPSVFAEHMQLLRDEGYVGVTLANGLRWLQSSGHKSGPRPVVLTFDDGFADFLTGAVPAMQRHGFKATVYLPTGLIDARRRYLQGRACLTWGEVARLHSDGIEFGSHTVTHRRLVQLGWPEIRTELLASKAAIEEHLGSTSTAFAYPYAFPQERPDFVGRFSRMLSDAGYRSCVTTRIGRVGAGDDPFCLRRLPVNSCDDGRLLRAKLEGAYDWLAPAQMAVKRIKQFIGR